MGRTAVAARYAKGMIYIHFIVACGALLGALRQFDPSRPVNWAFFMTWLLTLALFSAGNVDLLMDVYVSRSRSGSKSEEQRLTLTIDLLVTLIELCILTWVASRMGKPQIFTFSFAILLLVDLPWLWDQSHRRRRKCARKLFVLNLITVMLLIPACIEFGIEQSQLPARFSLLAAPWFVLVVLFIRLIVDAATYGYVPENPSRKPRVREQAA